MTFEEASAVLKNWCEKGTDSSNVYEAGRTFRNSGMWEDDSISCKTCERKSNCYYKSVVAPRMKREVKCCGCYKDSKIDLNAMHEKYLKDSKEKFNNMTDEERRAAYRNVAEHLDSLLNDYYTKKNNS